MTLEELKAEAVPEAVCAKPISAAFTTRSDASVPAKKSTMFLAAMIAILSAHSTVMLAACGVNTTLG